MLCEDDHDDGVAEHACAQECPSSVERLIKRFKSESLSEGKPKSDVEICLSTINEQDEDDDWAQTCYEARYFEAWLSVCDVFETLKFQAGNERFWRNYSLKEANPYSKLEPANTIFGSLLIHEFKGTIQQE